MLIRRNSDPPFLFLVNVSKDESRGPFLVMYVTWGIYTLEHGGCVCHVIEGLKTLAFFVGPVPDGYIELTSGTPSVKTSKLKGF